MPSPKKLLAHHDYYSDDARDFLKAIQRFKESHHCPCPSMAEVLQVYMGLGYRKVAVEQPLPTYRINGIVESKS